METQPPPPPSRRDLYIAAMAALGPIVHLILRAWAGHHGLSLVPLFLLLILGGLPLLTGLLRNLSHGETEADLLARLAIITAAVMSRYLVGSIIVLMLAGGAALEQFASARASRAPSTAFSASPSVYWRDIDVGAIKTGAGHIAIWPRSPQPDCEQCHR